MLNASAGVAAAFGAARSASRSNGKRRTASRREIVNSGVVVFQALCTLISLGFPREPYRNAQAWSKLWQVHSSVEACAVLVTNSFFVYALSDADAPAAKKFVTPSPLPAIRLESGKAKLKPSHPRCAKR